MLITKKTNMHCKIKLMFPIIIVFEVGAEQKDLEVEGKL